MDIKMYRITGINGFPALYNMTYFLVLSTCQSFSAFPDLLVMLSVIVCRKLLPIIMISLFPALNFR